MTPAQGRTIRAILQQQERELLGDWVKNQLAATTLRADLMKENELREQSREFIGLLRAAVASGNLDRVDGPEWSAVRDFLAGVSRTRAQQGFSPSETATF